MSKEGECIARLMIDILETKVSDVLDKWDEVAETQQKANQPLDYNVMSFIRKDIKSAFEEEKNAITDLLSH